MKNIIFQYMITDERVDRRGSPKEWVNGTRGDLYRESSEISKKSFAIYAKKIGVDHHFSTRQVYTKGSSGAPRSYLYECLRVIYDPIYDKYDNVLFADSDIIANTEENIFDLVDDHEMYGIYESEIRTGNGGGYNSWDFKDKQFEQIKTKFDRLGLPVRGLESPFRPSRFAMLNTGVVLWTKEGRMKAREHFDDWKIFFYDGLTHRDMDWVNNDQPFISSQILKHDMKLKCIDQTWNDTPNHYLSYDDWKDQNFLHYTGGGGKVQLIEHQKEGLFKYV